MLRSLRLLFLQASILAVAACGPQGKEPGDNQVIAPTVKQAAPQPPAVPSVDQPLARRDLLLAALEAGSNHALGIDDKAEQQKLDGRTVTFRMRLCAGAANVTQSFDEEDRVWKVEVEPDLSMDGTALGKADGQMVAAEGFWISYPFLLQPGCPGTPGLQTEGGTVRAVQQQTLGIAQFFGPDEVRGTQRGSRPYSITEELSDGQTPEAVDLILQGRLQRLGTGRVITCSDPAVGDRPTCVISVKIDRVTMETASGTTLGEWSRS